jgi:flagellar basal-body rod protein FlgB
MDFSNLSIFNAMAGRMAWLTQRQEVLAENVANADTPGYKARDLAPLDFATLLRDSGTGMGVARTSGGHIQGSGERGRFRVDNGAISATTESGNAVELEKELMKVAENQMNYSMVINLYKKHLAMVRIALGRGA